MAKRFADAIFEAEKHTKHEQKHAALSGLTGDDLRLVREALNPHRIFNIKEKSLEDPLAYANVDRDYEPFFTLLDMLHARTLSGSAAKATVTAVLGQYTEHTATALRRVLLKDLRCGATESTINKLYKGLVPTFEVMLAGKMPKKHEKNQYKWQFPLLAEGKYDGNRMIAIVTRGLPVTYLSRNGKEFDWVEGAFDQDLQALLSEFGAAHSIVVDGEVLAVNKHGKMDFSLTNQAKKAGNAVAKDCLKFFAFDLMTRDEWDAQQAKHVQLHRSKYLASLIDLAGTTRVVKARGRIIHSVQEGHDFYQQVLAEGYEGLILKNVDGKYAWKRTDDWVKWKPVYEADLRIKGLYLGDKGKKNEDKLGGFFVEGADENGNVIDSDCGGISVNHPKAQPMLEEIAKLAGVDLEQVQNVDQWFRDWAWKNQDYFINKIGMIEYQELSLALGATKYSLRFPVLICLRDDK